MLKRIDSTGGWYIWDTSRDPYNIMSHELAAHSAGAEGVFFGAGMLDATSNGWKLRSTDANTNTSGGTFIYICFAENPFKHSLAR